MKRLSRRHGTDLSSTVARQWEYLRESKESEWEDHGMCDDVYYKCVHKPCGTEVLILMGNPSICPKCQPEEWAKAYPKMTPIERRNLQSR